MSPLHLTDAEIADICQPLQQPAAQVRHLRALGLTVSTKPNGRPLVIRSHAEAVLSGHRAPAPAQTAENTTSAGPDKAALILRFGNRRHGSTTKAQPA